MGAPANVVRLQPVGIEFEVEENETVLDAAFRQGIALPHGCKEGQCSACKCVLTEGDVELKKYSTFALNEMERGQDYILLCRTLAYSDLEVELLNYDEEVLSKSIPVKDFTGTVTSVSALTHDIRRLEITLAQPLKFWAGQYVDITLPGPEAITRSFSMANSPGESQKLAFIIKKYPNGRFSSRLDGDLAVGTEVAIKGPYGTCFRRENKTGAMILVGGGSGMSPLWSILHDHISSGEVRPVRFFYGARTQNDLFYLEHFAELAAKHPEFTFVPVLSHAADDTAWGGAKGFVHEAVGEHLRGADYGEDVDVYACGPSPMIEALTPVLQMSDVESDRIFFDKFTPANN
ncbi:MULTISPECIES: 2Fe-2S iron-sulfur cluster-binding protein [Bradyrhizobium]|uniref:2Fe-2S iron-sulfur cluster-binding protein n=1 Tax=Bradyrhizobium TaxID=374 RepID=UPI000231D3B9|nr:2Fe-2S iron-sulfur cluster-binding protein [Bradyrhizobium japonicum]AJA64063.1 CDP-6-deoxy-delta-3,4-glucoseen reductase [Bradyrhizobium japonicum]KMJ95881.1 CDP-6-deoxy-delta-3,4-glucoseen reductase [Bradyrhizobium japonicum]MCS3539117.1 propane monooxygenase reductase subunit [Bradyrhizobium japonicum]MCS3984796.1 propane monooxygenase reductase subunit [Bradyrhizobium japonicum]MCS4020388.1 propane monooxygenase reductase subunit [Bradyrhizobium japonicum]